MRVTERTVGITASVTAGGCFVIAAWLLVPWAAPPGDVPEATDFFSTTEIARAEHYSWWARVWSWSSLAIQLLVVSAFVTRPARSLVTRWLRGPAWWRAATVVAVVMVTVRVVTLPLGIAAQRHRRAYGLSVQSWPAWTRDVAVSLAISTVMTGMAAVVLLLVVHRWRRLWPLIAAALLAGTVVVGSWGYPLAVEPLFNSFASMPDGEFRADIMELADREGVVLDDVLVADASRRTTTLNAYVSGMGATRRVVVYDTLLEQAPDDQVLSVVAHELAHARHGDVVIGTGLGALGAAAAVGLLPFVLRRRDAVALATAVVAFVAWTSVVAAPVENTISRQIEVRADQDALKGTGDPVAFRGVQVALARRSLADPSPPVLAHWWWGSHPTVLQRLALSEDTKGVRRLRAGTSLRPPGRTLPPRR